MVIVYDRDGGITASVIDTGYRTNGDINRAAQYLNPVALVGVENTTFNFDAG